jgi:nucleoside phosphorylase
MTQCIARHSPAAALLVGTCGGFAGRSLPLGAVVAGESVRLVDGAVALGTAALPDPMPSHVTFDVALHDALVSAGARSVQIANTLGITTDDELATRLAAGGADVEHLEAFAFARACARAGLPCSAALAVANGVGSKGRAEWLAGHVGASASAGELVLDARSAIARALALRTSTTARSPEQA